MATPVPSLKTGIVIPVFNRRATTLRCLENLGRLGVFDWAEIIVVDDGSTDGTREAVQSTYPSAIILGGNGSLWWGGAILLGMRHAVDAGAGLIFWLNDDCLPRPGTLELLARDAAEYRGIAVGQAFTPSGLHYGAFQRTRSGLRPILATTGETLECDAFGGNCVCISRAVVDRIGLVDAQHFPHVFGDADYGLRWRFSGERARVLGDAICYNEDNHATINRSWLFSDVPLGRVFRSFFSPKSNLYVPAFFRFKVRHWGAVGLLTFFEPYLRFLAFVIVRLIVPQRLLRKRYGARSQAWKRENFQG